MTVSAALLNDFDQFAAAYGFAASPARLALEGHDWKAATLFEVKPAWFPWNRFRIAGPLRKSVRGDLAAARPSIEELPTIRRVLPASLYHWSGSIMAQWEAATVLIAFAEGKKDEGLKLILLPSSHARADAVDISPALHCTQP